MALSSIDLFTGIGGITLALQGIAHPLLYCDIAPECHQVLHRLIKKNKIPKCPISSDVKTLNKAWMKRHGIRTNPDIIVGGFPCTSVSTLGNKDGFKNTIDGSGLFYQILRLADELDTPYLFLENVQNILNMEMEAIVRELVHKRGYSIRWCVNSAKNMGAPHQRNRWFCLAYKKQQAIRAFSNYKPYNWNVSREPDRTTSTLPASKEAAKKLYKRHEMLGNSVVPDCVRYAFMFLWGGMGAIDYTMQCTLDLRQEPSTSDSKSETRAIKTITCKGKNRWPKCGMVRSSEPGIVHDVEFAMPKTKPRNVYKNEIILDPRAYHPGIGPGGNLKLELLDKPVVYKSWSTCRRGATRPSNYITSRTSRDLPTQVRFEVRTKNRDNPMNPRFTEFMMGYPPDWTLF